MPTDAQNADQPPVDQDAEQPIADRPLPPPDSPPPTMPESARVGGAPPPSGYAGKHRADGARQAGGIPPGTGPEAPASLGTSEDSVVADGVHDPDVGPGGKDFDTATPPLAGRPNTSRQP